MVSSAVSTEFYKNFQQRKADILASLEASTRSRSELTSELAQVRSELRAVLPWLPTYDQRSYELVSSEGVMV